MNRHLIALFALSIIAVVNGRELAEDFIRLPSEKLDLSHDDSVGTRWAILIAGSNGYWNYRHQEDVCHAYQILKTGGLKEENIVVFMYDDIAYNSENPRQGIIINSPYGDDVYHGVPKDYTGDDVNVDNFFAVLLGDKTKVKGGSGKVVDSGPNDRIFIYYSDHGGPGVLGMPTNPYMYANDLNEILKQKHASGTYKSLVFYLEACESGSIFEGLLPQGLNIYATTASGPDENSWGTYCPGEYPSPPLEYDTCLGDLYSVAWMEDCDAHNLQTETIKQQYKLVKERTSSDNSYYGSHVMQYGDLPLSTDNLYFSIQLIGKVLFGLDKVPEVLNTVRSAEKPLVDDWTCLKTFVRTFETHCGSLSQYGMKHMRSIANLCNSGVTNEQMAAASSPACTTFPSNPWSSLSNGFTA
ncbi:hypothetical protein L1987_05184 [Smallanthus sonchifolius]|uniref:Uncharacterized protein n=1 Tax=Smallanthus sonchifolius TaxID=185202 RepID=A0ACB9JUY4_9ASTR|nr:hypothetical protein L1987_05184 [Smallanthus sonchifolius]